MSKPLPPGCERAREQLGLRVESELDALQFDELRLHLDSCADCREVERWMTQVDRLAAAEPDPGVTVAHLAELEAKILYGLPAAPRRAWWRRFALPTLVPSAALALFVFLIVRDTAPDPLEQAPLVVEAEPQAPQEELDAPMQPTPVAGVGRQNQVPMVVPERSAPVGDAATGLRDANRLQPQLAVQNPSADESTPDLAKTRGPAEIATSATDETLPSEAELQELTGAAVRTVEEAVARQRAAEDPLLAALRLYRTQPSATGMTDLIALLNAEDPEEESRREKATLEGQRLLARESRGARDAATPSSEAFERSDGDGSELLAEALLRWLGSPARVPADSLALREAQALLDELE